MSNGSCSGDRSAGKAYHPSFACLADATAMHVRGYCPARNDDDDGDDHDNGTDDDDDNGDDLKLLYDDVGLSRMPCGSQK